MHQYGISEFETKLQNYLALGPKPFSIIAYHNRFFEHCRGAFVLGAYYPALTGACALGERILNHLILLLRDDFKDRPEYRRVCRKQSFDKWEAVIGTLGAWDVFLPTTIKRFREFARARNQAVHFNPETDTNDRALALEAIKLLSEIIHGQFAAMGPLPWILGEVPGEMYIKKAAESSPFIRKVYLPNCLHVGPLHTIDGIGDRRMIIRDNHRYEDTEISDEEFCRLRREQGGKS